MENALVSVVIPIYNVEKYLDRCMESIVNQTYQNLEIIMVDDGSPDRCPEMCEEWAARDSRIKVIHKQNAGLGMARNTGIENANGEYICFFDSDDYIKPETIEQSYDAAKREDADIVVFGLETINREGKCTRSVIPNPKKLCYRGSEIQEVFLPNLIGTDPKTGYSMNIWMSACVCLYSMKMIHEHGWRFASEREIISEDVYSLLDLYGDVTCVAVVPKVFYCYCENATSLTKTYRQDRYERIKGFYEISVHLCEQKDYPETVKKRLIEPYLSFTVAALKQIIAAGYSKREKRKLCMDILRDPYLYAILLDLNLSTEKLTKRILYRAIIAKRYEVAYLTIVAKSMTE